MNCKQHDTPLVTVVVLAYEQEEYLERCILSICEQNYTNIELLICDDGSSNFSVENTKHFVKQVKKANIVRYEILHNERNLGTVKNCNLALAHTHGALLKFLAADDIFADADVIGDMAVYFSDKAVQVVAGRGVVDSDSSKGKLLPTEIEFARLLGASPQQTYELLCTRPWSAILAPAVMFRTVCLREFRGFDESYRYLEDWPFWVALSKRGIPILHIPRVIVRYGLAGISTVKNTSTRNYQVRKQYLEECRMVLKSEYTALKEKSRRCRAVQCRLSERCLARRERMLDCQMKGSSEVDRTLLDLPALFYQKLAGGIGNNRRMPAGLIIALCIAGGVGIGFRRWCVAGLCMGIISFCALWNGLLHFLKRTKE